MRADVHCFSVRPERVVPLLCKSWHTCQIMHRSGVIFAYLIPSVILYLQEKAMWLPKNGPVAFCQSCKSLGMLWSTGKIFSRWKTLWGSEIQSWKSIGCGGKAKARSWPSVVLHGLQAVDVVHSEGGEIVWVGVCWTAFDIWYGLHGCWRFAAWRSRRHIRSRHPQLSESTSCPDGQLERKLSIPSWDTGNQVSFPLQWSLGQEVLCCIWVKILLSTSPLQRL